MVFVFSRKRIDQTADNLNSLDLTSASEKAEIHIFVEQSVSRLKGGDRRLPQIIRLKQMLKRGLGVHHAGLSLLPNSIQFSSIQFSSIQLNPVRFSSTQSRSIRFKSFKHAGLSLLHFTSIQFSSVQFNPFIVIHFDSIQFNFNPFNAYSSAFSLLWDNTELLRL